MNLPFLIAKPNRAKPNRTNSSQCLRRNILSTLVHLSGISDCWKENSPHGSDPSFICWARGNHSPMPKFDGRLTLEEETGG